MKNRVLTALALLWFSVTAPVQAADAIFIQSTTSTQNSGFLDALLPIFTQDTGIAVRVVAVGTGQAIKNAKNGDGDVLLVHSKDDEEVFVKAGWGLERLDVMYNDFVIIGPRLDPAGIRASADVTVALQKIAALQVPFLSRGDDSGTHKAEKKLWTATGIDVAAASGSWYREAGLGMGATLMMSTAMNAYTLSDRATWISFARKGNQDVLFSDDWRLFNQYGVIAVNPARHPHVNALGAERFVDWITGPKGQAEIAAFKIGGEQLFFPNAAR